LYGGYVRPHAAIFWTLGRRRLPSTLERRNHGDIAAHQLGQQLLIH
jgi:hypothetical protein